MKTYNIVWSLVLASNTPPIIFLLHMSFIINLKLIPNMVRAARRTPPKTQVCGLARHLLIGTWLLPISQLPVHEIYNVTAVESLPLLPQREDSRAHFHMVVYRFSRLCSLLSFESLVDFGMHSNRF